MDNRAQLSPAHSFSTSWPMPCQWAPATTAEKLPLGKTMSNPKKINMTVSLSVGVMLAWNPLNNPGWPHTLNPPTQFPECWMIRVYQAHLLALIYFETRFYKRSRKLLVSNDPPARQWGFQAIPLFPDEYLHCVWSLWPFSLFPPFLPTSLFILSSLLLSLFFFLGSGAQASAGHLSFALWIPPYFYYSPYLVWFACICPLPSDQKLLRWVRLYFSLNSLNLVPCNYCSQLAIWLAVACYQP